MRVSYEVCDRCGKRISVGFWSKLTGNVGIFYITEYVNNLTETVALTRYNYSLCRECHLKLRAWLMSGTEASEKN